MSQAIEAGIGLSTGAKQRHFGIESAQFLVQRGGVQQLAKIAVGKGLPGIERGVQRRQGENESLGAQFEAVTGGLFILSLQDCLVQKL